MAPLAFWVKYIPLGHIEIIGETFIDLQNPTKYESSKCEKDNQLKNNCFIFDHVLD
jgi:hypothetical protein